MGKLSEIHGDERLNSDELVGGEFPVDILYEVGSALVEVGDLSLDESGNFLSASDGYLEALGQGVGTDGGSARLVDAAEFAVLIGDQRERVSDSFLGRGGVSKRDLADKTPGGGDWEMVNGKRNGFAKIGNFSSKGA